MADATLLGQILDSLTEPVLVGDTDHKVVYMNRAAAEHYTGGRSLMGTSLLDCHNEKSGKIMIEVLAAIAGRRGRAHHPRYREEAHLHARRSRRVGTARRLL